MGCTRKGEKVKEGGRLYGFIYKRPDGTHFYMALRKQEQTFRDGAKTVSHAVRDKQACWAIDVETIKMLRRREILDLAILNTTNGDLWISDVPTFEAAPIRNYEGIGAKGGARQHYLPTTAIQSYIVGKVRI
ncbi:hypothetical protein NKH72_22045 [Mesorhizobium sp. M0955]|uniref:hypothetical protein n=1 Tax=Mesorhizobium sp. M0955 TaxID=2957033 RepID=UPI00333D0139